MTDRLPVQFLMADLSNGVIQGVKYLLAPPNSVVHAMNVTFDENYGEATTRQGTTLIGNQVVAEDNTINGLYQFIDSASGPNSRLISAVNVAGDASQALFYLDAGNVWQSTLTGDTAGLRTRFETFLDRVVRVNGTDAVASWDGNVATAWLTTGGPLDLANFPRGTFVKVYKDQVCTAGISSRPDDLDVSSVVNTAGTAISWTSANRRIRINPEDNSNITGLGEIGSLLIIFKRFAMYRWTNRGTEADTVVDVGCSSHESIANGRKLLFFFNERGIWQTDGGYPIRISRPVQTWIDNMDATYYGNVAGFCDNQNYYCSIGNVTLPNGNTYNNVVLRYTLDTKEWTVFSYAHQYRVFSPYVSASAVNFVGGDTTARVLQMNSGLTDNGTAINYEVESHDIDFSSKGMLKEISERIMAYGLNPVDVVIQVQIEGEDWITLGAMNKEIEEFLINERIKGHYMRFRVIGTHSTVRFRFQGLELPTVTLLGYAA